MTRQAMQPISLTDIPRCAAKYFAECSHTDQLICLDVNHKHCPSILCPMMSISNGICTVVLVTRRRHVNVSVGKQTLTFLPQLMQFFASYTSLLKSSNYVTRRQSLKVQLQACHLSATAQFLLLQYSCAFAMAMASSST